MNKYHLFLDGEALCIEADGWTEENGWMCFYRVEGTGQETTFPPTWKRLIFRAKPERERVEMRSHFHWVRHSLLRRFVIIPASAIEARRAETAQTGSVEDESAVGEAETPVPTPQSGTAQ